MKKRHPDIDRRRFLQHAAAGAMLAPLGLASGGCAPAESGFPNFSRGEVVRTGGRLTGTRLSEAARDIPVVGDSDVLVVGGGPAGIAAAIAAARAGAKTRLIESAGCLGGVWTAGMLTKILDVAGKEGLIREILDTMAARGSEVAAKTRGTTYDPELMKVVLEEMCVGAGIGIRLHTRLVGAIVDRRNRLTGIVTESKSGREAWTAQRFVDCSGDGDLAAQAGCRFDVGIGPDCECQPMSMMALVTGIRAGDIPELIREVGGAESKQRLRDRMREAGADPSYQKPTLRHLHGDIFSIMTNHERGVPAYDANSVTEATIRARAEVHAIVAGLRRLGGPWKDLAVVATAEQIGVREGRRIRGRYTVTADDLAGGARHADAVCRASFGVDIHELWDEIPGDARAEIARSVVQARQLKVKSYDIPLRALIAADVEGLMMAGRCISGDFIAHSSYRVTGNAVPMGEAAGVASAASLRQGVMPHELNGLPQA